MEKQAGGYKQGWTEWTDESEYGCHTEVLDPVNLTAEEHGHLLAAILDQLGLEFVKADNRGTRYALRPVRKAGVGQ